MSQNWCVCAERAELEKVRSDRERGAFVPANRKRDESLGRDQSLARILACGSCFASCGGCGGVRVSPAADDAQIRHRWDDGRTLCALRPDVSHVSVGARSAPPREYRIPDGNQTDIFGRRLHRDGFHEFALPSADVAASSSKPIGIPPTVFRGAAGGLTDQ